MRSAWVSVAALALVVLFRLPLRELPLERDEGAYATAAVEMSRGAVLYRDVFDHKPPAVHLAYRASFALGGTTPGAVRGLALVAALATAAGLLALGRSLGRPGPGAFAAVAYAVASALPAYDGGTANAEMLLAAPMVWGLVAGLAGQPLLAGALLGALPWLKPTAVVVTLWALVHLAVSRGGYERGSRLATGARLALGAALPSLALGGWLVAQDTVTAFRASVLDFNVAYAALAERLLPGGRTAWIGSRLLVTAARDPLTWTAMPFGLLLAWRRKSPAGAALTLGWCLASLAQTLPGFFFRHYLQAALPALAWCAGLALDGLRAELARRLESGPRLRALAPGVVVAALVPAVAVAVAPSYWLALGPAEKSVAIYGAEPFALSGEVAAEVARRTSPDQPILVLGAEPEVYFLSGRRPASRVLYSYAWSAPLDPTGRARSELLARLAAREPALVVVYALRGSWPFPDPADASLFAAIADRLDARFALVGTLDWPDGARARTVAITRSPAPIQLWQRRP